MMIAISTNFGFPEVPQPRKVVKNTPDNKEVPISISATSVSAREYVFSEVKLPLALANGFCTSLNRALARNEELRSFLEKLRYRWMKPEIIDFRVSQLLAADN